ncbi:hypothetical protein LPJ78_001640 [Coemansia sp. RSA 989]|nr:hypothetical protein BX667DRAFT_295098 [Coemansia mojavensis]KAJ1743312.1 hypothetical protein LPJ68_001106 [Coemansia sp. RSA 1086]KAJ1752972.1 hypothetical protein LPJ79_000794 [Coemansia sp. RSA 1821]KAJ1866689.1 hypothetical protein LPJ78_001640 [Coemansia sp. RSA 989]KAJ1875487.1 hypothetical protein LPJ55_000652 [Coemansia sp. RSA 990]KAJ2627802.1 hypothetical protein H4R22_004217 [Coemansia sp. RSA 1290]KAJ2651924.1 hypothetical protein IWW40_001472 [Coemansia sp. RSA 1250]KAJ26749
MVRMRRKRMHCNNKELHNRYKLKRRTKDLDQIQEDLKPENKHRLLTLPVDEDLPGLGQHYCVECAKHYIDDAALERHRRGREHKRRVRDLKVPAYTQKEAEAAAGLSTDNGRAMALSTGPLSLLSLKQKNDVALAAESAKKQQMEAEG